MKRSIFNNSRVGSVIAFDSSRFFRIGNTDIKVSGGAVQVLFPDWLKIKLSRGNFLKVVDTLRTSVVVMEDATCGIYGSITKKYCTSECDTNSRGHRIETRTECVDRFCGNLEVSSRRYSCGRLLFIKEKGGNTFADLLIKDDQYAKLLEVEEYVKAHI